MGEIVSAYGVRGWVKVRSYTRPPAQILQYTHWLLGEPAGEWRTMRVTATRSAAKLAAVKAAARDELSADKLFGKLAGVDDRTGANELRGRRIAVLPSQLARLPRGEYYWRDLIGLRVVNRAGESLGRVARLVETGANDVLVVQGAGGKATAGECVERLLPWSDAVIIAVDLARRRLSVDWDAAWDAEN